MGQSWNILVVDDERYNIDLVRRALRPRPEYNIVAADSAIDALALLAKEKVDLLIVDQKMPSMTGAELLEKANEDGTLVPAIMSTAFPYDENVGRAVERGFVLQVLEKPWFSQEMLSAVDQAIHTP